MDKKRMDFSARFGQVIELIDELDMTDCSALHLAVQEENIDAVEMLLEKGANVNLTNSSDMTPFAIAIQKMNYHLVRRLLENGADPCLGNVDCCSFFSVCVQCGNNSIVALFLEKGIDVNKVNCDGLTPFHIAFLQRNWDMMELLLANGADPRIMNLSNQSDYCLFLNLCRDENNIRIVNLMFEKKVIDCNDDNFVPLLISSIVKGRNFFGTFRMPFDQYNDERQNVNHFLRICVTSHEVMLPETFLVSVFDILSKTDSWKLPITFREIYEKAFAKHLLENDYMNLSKMNVNKFLYELIQLQFSSFLDHLILNINPNLFELNINMLLCECARRDDSSCMLSFTHHFIQKIDFTMHKVDVNQILIAGIEFHEYNFSVTESVIEKLYQNSDIDFQQLIITCIRYNNESYLNYLFKHINKKNYILNLNELLNACIESHSVGMADFLLKDSDFCHLNFCNLDVTQVFLSCIEDRSNCTSINYELEALKTQFCDIAFALQSCRNLELDFDVNKILFTCVEKKDTRVALGLLEDRNIKSKKCYLDINTLFHLCIKKKELSFAEKLWEFIDYNHSLVISVDWMSLFLLYLEEYKEKLDGLNSISLVCIKLILLFDKSAMKPKFDGSFLSSFWDNCEVEMYQLNCLSPFNTSITLQELVKNSLNEIANIFYKADLHSDFIKRWCINLTENCQIYNRILTRIFKNGWVRYKYLKKGRITIDHSNLSGLPPKWKRKILENCSNPSIASLLYKLNNEDDDIKRRISELINRSLSYPSWLYPAT